LPALIAKLKHGFLLCGMFFLLPQFVSSAESQPSGDQASLRLPVEVVTKGGAREWVMVAVESQAIPEPSAAALLMLGGCALCLRRQRPQ
jgi:hypothetical protein